MLLSSTPLSGVWVVERAIHGDARGFLSRLFCSEALRTAGWTNPVAQVNQTFTTTRGTVRGMHFQRPPHSEMKLVSCLEGDIWDVAIDLRAGSPTFLRWHGEHLSAKNRRAMLIPEGCAHGFQTLADRCLLIYCHSAPYEPSFEGGVHPEDPAFGIPWPLPVDNLSARDRSHPFLADGFGGLAMT